MKEKLEKFTCNNCGSPLDKGNNYCEYCGSKVELDTNKKVEVKEDGEVLKVTYEPIKEDYSVLNARKDKNSNNNTFVVPFITSLITIFICTFIFMTYLTFFYKVENTTRVEKDVTVTDEGIADAVEKIYDAVVVVENYVEGEPYSTGTGFVYKKEDNKAYILTNQHVIDDATEVYVVLTDDSKVKATVVGGDEYSDIAVLSVDASKVYSIATIGSSEELRVGDTTFAVGAPLDAATYSWTVTRGILSGKNRLIEVQTGNFSSSNYVMQVLQTDAAINSGNSGGPLCNSNGEVIGITNMKIASSSVEGMGFAIPIETAIRYADKYISGETILRPYLGISMYDASSIRNQNLTGVYIQSVEDGSPAAKAGLKKGDIITGLGDTKIQNSAYLKYELYKYNVGEHVKVTYIRDGKEIKTTIILGSYPTN